MPSCQRRRDRMRKSWRSELQPGRVFELNRKTWSGRQVNVLSILPAEVHSYYPYFVEIDETGCIDAGSRHRSRNCIGSSLHPRNFKSGLVIRRRPELERFDNRDLELIRYGIKMDFTGRLLSRNWPYSFPPIPGTSWTIFWAYAETPFYCSPYWLSNQAIKAALQGAWHFSDQHEIRPYWPRRHPPGRINFWATAEECPRKLATLRRALTAAGGPVATSTTRIVARDNGDHWIIKGDQCTCPAFSLNSLTTVRKSDMGKQVSIWT